MKWWKKNNGIIFAEKLSFKQNQNNLWGKMYLHTCWFVELNDLKLNGKGGLAGGLCQK